MTEDDKSKPKKRVRKKKAVTGKKKEPIDEVKEEEVKSKKPRKIKPKLETKEESSETDYKEIISNVGNTVKSGSKKAIDSSLMGIRSLKNKNPQAFILGLLIALLLETLPFIWNTISTTLFDNALGVSLMTSFLFASVWIGYNIGRARSGSNGEEKAIQIGYFSAGVLLSFIIMMFPYFKYGLSVSILSLFLFFIIITLASGIMIHTSSLTEHNIQIKKNFNLVSKILISVSVIQFVTVGFVIAYFDKTTTAGILGFFYFLFATVLYLGVLFPVLGDLKQSLAIRFEKFRSRDGEVRLNKLVMKEEYIEILEKNGIVLISQLENLDKEGLMAIEGITEFDADMILSYVFDYDEEDEEEEE